MKSESYNHTVYKIYNFFKKLIDYFFSMMSLFINNCLVVGAIVSVFVSVCFTRPKMLSCAGAKTTHG